MDTIPIWIKFVEQLPQIITAVGVLFAGYWAYKSRQQSVSNEKKIDESQKKIDVIGENVDGKMEKLLSASQAAASAEGQLKERNAERAYLTDSPPVTPIANGKDEPLKVIVVEEEPPI